MDVVVVAISSLSTSPLVIVLFNINLGLVTILGISKGALACLVARPDGILQVGSSTPVLHKKIPHLFPYPKHGQVFGLSHRATGHYVWMRIVG